MADSAHQNADTSAEPWRAARDGRVVVREHVPNWAGHTGIVKSVGPDSLSRPVKVLLDDEDEEDPRDFDHDKLAPADTR